MGIRTVLLAGIFFLGIVSISYADRVCLKKSNGELVEYQSSATAGTLLHNRELEGLNPADYEEREVTLDQYKALRETWIDTPARDMRKKEEATRMGMEASLKAKLGLSDKEFQDLKEVLSD